MGNIRGIDAGSMRGTGRLTFVDFRAASAATPLSAAAAASPTAYGAAIASAQTRRATGVSSIAKRYETFDSALLPMVLASGVHADAAIAVADAIRRTPALLTQAQRAFEQARQA